MKARRRTALLVDGGSPFAQATLGAIAERFDHVIVAASAGLPSRPNVEQTDLEPSDGGSWERLSTWLRDRQAGLEAIIHCAPPAEGPERSGRNITSAWLALREAIRLLPEGEAGVYVSQHIAPADARPQHEAEIEAARLAGDCALIDAMRMGRHPRINRLVVDPGADPNGIAAAAGFLVDERSRFMTGAEIALDATPASNQAGLEGKTVLVTGATSGLGRATAVEAAALGAFVAIGGRKPDLADETLALVRARGGDGMICTLDVTEPDNWRSAIEAITGERGALHGLVNNAGEARHGRIDELQPEDLAFLLRINYRGTALGMSAAEELIARSGGGSIVNISSVAGVRGGPGAAAYSASKAAVVGLSRARGRALASGSSRVRVNALQPGLIWTDSVVDSLGEEGARKFRERIEPQTPLGRVATPEDIALPVCFLLSDSAAAITGQRINVSGGLEISFP